MYYSITVGGTEIWRKITSDFTAISLDYNKGTDAAADWTGTTIAFSGTSGANEFRWQRTGGGGGTATGNAAWPNIIRPGANAAVEEMYAFSADTTGLKVNYDGTIAQTMVVRFNFDNVGTPASAMQFSAFQDVADTTPTVGTQTNNATDGRNIVNGHATDTSSTSYLKINAFGSGVPTGGSQETPSTSGNAGTTLAATSGTAGSVSPSAASWLTTWQSAQGWIQYITAPSIWKATTAGFWYIACVLYVGPNLGTGAMSFVPFCLNTILGAPVA